MTFSQLDVSKISSKYVGEKVLKKYQNTDFSYTGSDGYVSILEHEFNIRDIKIYTTTPEDSETHDIAHNIIVSCFNNGILFFQAARAETITSNSVPRSEAISWSSMLEGLNDDNRIHLTYIMEFENPSRLFAFGEYYSQDITPYRLFVTQSIPAIVLELSINEHFNVHFVRYYTVSSQTEHRFIGKDAISANEKFLAHLMFDLEKGIEVVRIYYRDESNFAYGHADIELTSFTVEASSIHFLAYQDSESLFIKNAFIGELYSVNDVELVIDTKSYRDEYQKHLNNTYQMNVTAFNIENKDEAISTYFNVTFAGKYDMNSYFIGRKEKYNLGYNYGDMSFAEIVSDFYYGPDLKFSLSLKNESDNNLVIPNITKTNQVGMVREFKGDQDCANSFFSRFINADTDEEEISFYCIHEKDITQYIFGGVDVIIKETHQMEYQRFYFFDFFVMLESQSENIDSDQVVILSKDESKGTAQYSLHYFDLRSSLLTWRSQVKVNINSKTLRDVNPLIDFDGGNYVAFIDSKETELFLVSSEGETKISLSISSKVKNLDVC